MRHRLPFSLIPQRPSDTLWLCEGPCEGKARSRPLQLPPDTEPPPGPAGGSNSSCAGTGLDNNDPGHTRATRISYKLPTVPVPRLCTLCGPRAESQAGSPGTLNLTNRRQSIYQAHMTSLRQAWPQIQACQVGDPGPFLPGCWHAHPEPWWGATCVATQAHLLRGPRSVLGGLPGPRGFSAPSSRILSSAPAPAWAEALILGNPSYS